jgi:hypothetical protein
MKLSVSVPDQLWDEARQQRPDLNPSHLVQVALDSWVRRSSPGYSQEPPEDARPAFTAAREHLAAQARREFEDGYRAALAATAELNWRTIQDLADGRFDVTTWAGTFGRSVFLAETGRIPQDRAPRPEEWDALVRAVGSVVDHPVLDEEPGRSAPFLRGFGEAMRTVWKAIEGPDLVVDTPHGQMIAEAKARKSEPSDPAKDKPSDPAVDKEVLSDL